MSFPYPYPGPVPPYNNVPINPQYYAPGQFFVTAIILGQTTTVTTSINHNYVIGQLCRLIIPPVNGSLLLNEQTGYVISIPNPNQVTLNINSTGADPFKTSVSTYPTQPQILAVGDSNSGNINASGISNVSTLIPGSYINISPG